MRSSEVTQATTTATAPATATAAATATAPSVTPTMRGRLATLSGIATPLALGVTAALRLADSAWWPSAYRVALGVLGVRLCVMAWTVARRELRWSRLLAPAILLLALAPAGGGWQVRLVLAGLLEVAFVAVALRELRRRGDGLELLEVRVAKAGEALLPEPIARLIAFELVVIGSALRFAAGGFCRPPPDGFGYHRESGLRMLLLALPLLAVGDVLLLELVVVPRLAPWLGVVLHTASAYGVVWLVGIYASARARPHRLEGGQLALHRGLLGRMTVAIAEIVSVAPLPAFADDWQRRAYERGALRLDLAGPPVVELGLRTPRRRTGVLGEGAAGTRLLVAVDDPAAFTAALAAARAT